MRNKAFTLAEVLVTLGVIGVVTAMTLPSVINKFRAKTLEVGFKKSYSNVNKAFLNTKIALETDSVYRNYGTYNGGYSAFTEFRDEFYNKLGARKVFKGTYNVKNYIGENGICKIVGYCTLPTIILPDGSSIATEINGARVWFIVDTNGPYKKPNRRGHDIFAFIINTNNDKIQFTKMEKMYTEEELEHQTYPDIVGYPCSVKSKQATNGNGCAWYAFNNVNPDDETKTYWDNLPR